jgi:hypothetical protein
MSKNNANKSKMTRRQKTATNSETGLTRTPVRRDEGGFRPPTHLCQTQKTKIIITLNLAANPRFDTLHERYACPAKVTQYSAEILLKQGIASMEKTAKMI